MLENVGIALINFVFFFLKQKSKALDSILELKNQLI